MNVYSYTVLLCWILFDKNKNAMICWVLIMVSFHYILKLDHFLW